MEAEYTYGLSQFISTGIYNLSKGIFWIRTSLSPSFTTFLMQFYEYIKRTNKTHDYIQDLLKLTVNSSLGSTIMWTRTADTECHSHGPCHGSFLEPCSSLVLLHLAYFQPVKHLFWSLKPHAGHISFHSILLWDLAVLQITTFLIKPVAMFSNKMSFPVSIQLKSTTTPKFFYSNLLSQQPIPMWYLVISLNFTLSFYSIEWKKKLNLFSNIDFLFD